MTINIGSRTIQFLWVFILILVSGCSGSEVPKPSDALETLPLLSEEAPVPMPSITPTPTAQNTPTPTATILPTDTPTPRPSPTPTLTPTSIYPQARVLMQANCRYGPGKAYLYSHGLYEGDHAEVHGRNYSASWLWIKPDNLERHCWVSATVVEVIGDAHRLPIVQSRLPHSTLYGPPQNVQAVRQGDRVIVSWEAVWMTQDDYRGYLIEATIC